MSVFSDVVRRFRRMAPSLLGACAVAYFAYHALQGDRGLVTWLKLSDEVDEARAALAVSLAEQQRLDRRVRLLRPDGLDPDMLDERVRAVLNLAGEDEVVIFYPTADGGF